MENEILWKWELLCDEFEEAKQNYINIFSPLINSLGALVDEADTKQNFMQIKKAEDAWNNWIEVHNELKKFVDKNT